MGLIYKLTFVVVIVESRLIPYSRAVHTCSLFVLHSGRRVKNKTFGNAILTCRHIDNNKDLGQEEIAIMFSRYRIDNKRAVRLYFSIRFYYHWYSEATCVYGIQKLLPVTVRCSLISRQYARPVYLSSVMCNYTRARIRIGFTNIIVKFIYEKSKYKLPCLQLS